MSILVKKTGFPAAVQDSGRKKFRRFGINPNGAMDLAAMRLINILLGNDDAEAVLEMNFPAPEFLFEEAAIFALGGADFGAQLDGESIENWRAHRAEAGNVLSFAKNISGSLIYLSVQGGFQIKKWLNSASTNLTAKIGGLDGRNLQKNHRIFFNSKCKAQNSKFSYKIANDLISDYSDAPTVRVIAGAEFERLTAFGEQTFLSQSFTVGKGSNRMGFRLEGEPLYLLDETEIISAAVNFGTIQLLPDGQMISLMADHQTSGGYPRIANVVLTDLPLLAQLGANDKISFELISVGEAESLAIKFENNLNWLRIGVKLNKIWA